MTIDAILADRRLTSLDRAILQFLDRKSRGHPECWVGNATLAKHLGRATRTIQVALRRLSLFGFIRRVADRMLSSRRRIVLLWRASRGLLANSSPGTPDEGAEIGALATPSEGAEIGALGAPDSAPTSFPPLDPPIEVSEDVFNGSLEDPSRTVASPQSEGAGIADGTGRDDLPEPDEGPDPFGPPEPIRQTVSAESPAAEGPDPELAAAIADAERRSNDPDRTIAKLARTELLILRRDGLRPPAPPKAFAPPPPTLHVGTSDRPRPAAPIPTGRDESVPLAPILALVRERGSPAAIAEELLRRWREEDNLTTRGFVAAAVATLAPGELEGLIVDAERVDIRQPARRFAKQAAPAIRAARAGPTLLPIGPGERRVAT